MWDSIKTFFISQIVIGDLKLFFSPLDVILKLLMPVLVIIILYRLLIFFLKKLVGKIRVKPRTKNNILKYTRRGLKIIFVVGVVFISGAFLGEEIVKYMTGFWKVVYTPFITAGSSKISIITILLTIPVFLTSSWIARKAKVFIENSVLKSLSLQAATKFSLTKLIRYGIQIILILVGLSVIGIDFSSIAVIFGVLGIGVGFGLQGVISNLFAGVVILFERPVKENDRIIVNGVEGDVVKIRMLSTIITTLTNETIFIPNAQLVGNNIHNYSHNSPEIITVNKIQVAYESDLEEVIKILQEIGRENPYAIAGREPEVRVTLFDSSGIEMELRVWIKQAMQKHQSLSWSNYRIWREFKSRGVGIPFPQLDLHIKRQANKVV